MRIFEDAHYKWRDETNIKSLCGEVTCGLHVRTRTRHRTYACPVREVRDNEDADSGCEDDVEEAAADACH